MERQCTEGHNIAPGSDTCEGRHNAQPEVTPNLAQLMGQMILLQQENIALRREQMDHRGGAMVKKPERPRIDPDSTGSDWAIFIDVWYRYKQMGRLTNPNETSNELRATCAPEVNKLLFDIVGADIAMKRNY